MLLRRQASSAKIDEMSPIKINHDNSQVNINYQDDSFIMNGG